MGCVIGRVHYGIQVVFCFRYFTAYHYHHNSRLLAGIGNMQMLVKLIFWRCPQHAARPPITFHFHRYLWGCMCSTGPFQFRWLTGYIHSSCYYHHQIGGINLTQYHIFPWFCAWDVCCIIFCHFLHIHSGKPGILFSLLLCSLWWVQIVGYVLACKSCSFVCTLHHLIIIIVQTLWRHWTYKMPVRYILSSV